MRIAVVGVGGTGGFFGGMLARAGHDVTFVARGEHLRALQRSGLTVKSVTAGDFVLPVNATDNSAEIGPVDLVLFCVKSYDNATAIPTLPPLVGPETMVLSVQNGIDNEQQLAEAVGSEAVLGGLALIVTAIESPGTIAHTAGFGHIAFGELDGGGSPRTERLLTVLHDAEIDAELHPNINVALWNKFVGICAYSGVTSLTRLPIGPIMQCAETRDLFQATLAEVAAIGVAQGVGLPVSTVDGWMTSMDSAASEEPWASSSMHHDLKVGRRLEVEKLNGTAARLGRELGIPTPKNDVIYAALAPYANGAPDVPVAP